MGRLNRNILARLNRNILRRPAVEPGCDVISEGRQLRMCLEIVVSRYFVDKVVIVPVCFVFASRRPFLLIIFPAAHLLRVNKKGNNISTENGRSESGRCFVSLVCVLSATS